MLALQIANSCIPLRSWLSDRLLIAGEISSPVDLLLTQAQDQRSLLFSPHDGPFES